jgi:hypothetical protein
MLRLADRRAREHEAVGRAALVLGQDADGERVDGDVHGRGERVVQEDHRREEGDLVHEVDAHRHEERGDHADLHQEDPGAASPEALRRDRVDERADRPLERPRQIERADERADRRRPEALAAHLGGDRDGGEAERDALGDVKQEECGEPPLLGREQVGQGDSHAAAR